MDFETWYRIEFDPLPEVDKSKQAEIARIAFSAGAQHKAALIAEMGDIEQKLKAAVEFLANMINERESSKQGYSLAVRWRCLRDDLQKRYISDAMGAIETWSKDEDRAEKDREIKKM